MLYKYKVVDEKGLNREGSIDAPNRDVAISGLQRRGLIILSITEVGKKTGLAGLSIFNKVSLS